MKPHRILHGRLVAESLFGDDMQQDRSTGWRLGTNRGIQFGYQVVGLIMSAVMCVVFAKVFMTAFPVLEVNQLDQTAMAALDEATRAEAEKWQAAMTYKFVGAVNAIIHPKPHIMTALQVGIAIGLTRAGYTGALLADSKFAKLGDMDARYFKNVERTRIAVAPLGIRPHEPPALERAPRQSTPLRWKGRVLSLFSDSLRLDSLADQLHQLDE